MFYLTKAAMRHLRNGDAIVNTTSVTGYSPIWTPLIPSTFGPEEVASDDASYMSGQVLHPNGGEFING